MSNNNLKSGCVCTFGKTSPKNVDRISIIAGEDCEISIGEIKVLNTFLKIHMVNNCRLEIGKATLINGPLNIFMHEPSRVVIGDGCLFSRCDILTSDSHAIIDKASGARINPARDIIVGDHVWIGGGALILKGSSIQSESVVAARTVVTKSFPAHSLIAGVPGRVVRSGIIWRNQIR